MDTEKKKIFGVGLLGCQIEEVGLWGIFLPQKQKKDSFS